MKILGIDPGLQTIGFGIIEENGFLWECVDFGVIETSSKAFFSQRLLQISQDLHELLQEYQPNIIAIEELFFAKNVKTAMSVAHARGVILEKCAEYGCKIFEYKPMEIKMAMTGYGGAEKMQMQKMVASILRLESIPKPDDAADALATALCCAYEQKRNK